MKKRVREIQKKLIAYSMMLGMAAVSFTAAELPAHAEEISLAETDSEPMTGTYTVSEDWVEDKDAGVDEKTVYVKSSHTEEEETSTIACSYIDTNYSVLEYEKLRDMLTNNLFYSNVNAQISTSAVYTLSKDYLYILIVDDSAKEYRDIYHYVVGDHRCFLVEVREYRSEAESAKALEEDTPQEVGQKIAEEFTWDTAW